MTFEFYPGLSQNFSQLLDDADDYNVVIKVGEYSNTKEFRAHSNILRARSPYFKSALSQKWATKKDDIINFTKPNVSPIVFEMIIRYMYTGILDLKKQVDLDILDLLVASDELLIEELITFIQKYLIENQTEWLRNNFVKVLQSTVFQLESCKQLRDFCLNSICEDPKPFFNSPQFQTLGKNILIELLKRDDMLIDEIELWSYLIKWGISQTSKLKGKNVTNLNRWNKKSFLALKNTLNPFILHIRFFDISSKDFHSKIRPFKTVLPGTLFEDIVSFHLAEIKPKINKLPSRNSRIPIDSMIIKSKHAIILANWIQRKDSNAKILKDKYNFKLIYRASQVGYDINKIRAICDGQGACILIIKIKNNETIIGGYNPIGWKDNDDCSNNGYFYDLYHNYWCNTKESFIFSLDNRKGLEKFKISRVINNKFAIYDSYNYNIALNFGNSDLVINNNNGTCNQKYYESNILDINNFSIEEMEIFKFY
ncbi:hypothetical protein C1645_873867 [Glomus cerebriforme]|uniref:BTB/POZ domain-containing protein n=1 Tax=Glomus cerebriforme TaxID=658196 RepID=A0A397TFP2_9GLOM|nr:hypothetical protein C1645_873867 [Glomus cerebriforme]